MNRAAPRRRGGARQRAGGQRQARPDDGRPRLQAVPLQGRPFADLRSYCPDQTSTIPATYRRTVYRFMVRSVPQSVPRQPRLCRPEHQHADSATHADARCKRWRCSTIRSWWRRPSISPTASSRSARPCPAQIEAAYRLASGRLPTRRASAAAGGLRSEARPGERLPGAVQHERVRVRRLIFESEIHAHADCRTAAASAEADLVSSAAAVQARFMRPLSRREFLWHSAAGSAASRWPTCSAQDGLLAACRATRHGAISTAACIIAPRPSASCSSSCPAPPASATRSTTSRELDQAPRAAFDPGGKVELFQSSRAHVMRAPGDGSSTASAANG